MHALYPKAKCTWGVCVCVCETFSLFLWGNLSYPLMGNVGHLCLIHISFLLYLTYLLYPSFCFFPLLIKSLLMELVVLRRGDDANFNLLFNLFLCRIIVSMFMQVGQFHVVFELLYVKSITILRRIV